MATNNTAIPFTANQLATITRLGEAKAYPTMYQYIADLIKTGAIPVAGGANSDQYYWFDQASRINQNDTSSPTSVFIRAATKYGLSIDKKPKRDRIKNPPSLRIFNPVLMFMSNIF